LAIPNFQDLYDHFQNEVEGDGDTDLTAFGPGTLLDDFGAVAASMGQRIVRTIGRQAAKAFIATSYGSDLDYVATDRYGEKMARKSGESDAAYKARIFEWLEHHGASTPEALEFYANELVDGVKSAEITGEIQGGWGTLKVETESGATPQTVKSAILEDLTWWRPINVHVNVEVA